MARIVFQVESPLPPNQVVGALTDFSERRPELWPNIDPRLYRVHDVSASSALVTEGSGFMGGMWAKELYEWNGSGTVRATIQESNLWHPGGIWELVAEARAGGGSTLTVTRDRRAKSIKGRVLELMIRAFGPKAFAKDFLKAPAVSGPPRH